MPKSIVAVIGNADIEDNTEAQKTSFELGRLIIDNGFILATGGLGGVMEYASKGAKNSANYTENLIIGVLPDYNTENANKYIDIPLPTGLGLARNLMLISMSNAVIAVGGGSGTLNEISTAWQMNKLIVGLQINGWSKKLCGQALDERRDDIIFCAKDPQEAMQLINDKISYYPIQKFTGINKPRTKIEKIKTIIKNHFSVRGKLEFLGKGNEGFVFTDKKYVYKLIDQSIQPLALYWTFLSFSETLQFNNEITSVQKFEVDYLDEYIFIKYDYEETSKFTNNKNIHIDKFIDLLKQFRKINWILTDFGAKNLRLTGKGDLLIIDIGGNFLPASDYMFESMCRRAFVTYKLQGKFSDQQDFRKYLSSVNEKADFSLMKDLGFVENKLIQEFNIFYKNIITTDKKDILNPIIKDIFQSHIKVKSVFDYGSGSGDMSMLLRNLGLSVVAYEPEKNIVEHYKKKYYQNIDVLDYKQTQELITNKTKFDSVLCSLVLCHPLAKIKQARLDIIHQIMADITALSSNYIVIVICNPLYTYRCYSALQKRILPDNFNYKNEVKFVKQIHSSNRERYDIHRPLSFYESLFEKYNLNIKEIIQTKDEEQTSGIKNSDFMIFLLTPNKDG